MEYNATLKAMCGRSATFLFADDLDIAAIKKNAGRAEITAGIIFDEKAAITDAQRKKIFALIADMSEHTGDPIDDAHLRMKFEFMAATGCDVFSLARNGVSKNFASRYIEFLIDFFLENDIPFMNRLYQLDASMQRVLFIYLKHRACFVCGKLHSDVHHVNGSTIGMGGNRYKVTHEGREALCLCRIHHGEIHLEGESEFLLLHHLAPIVLTAELVERLGL